MQPTRNEPQRPGALRAPNALLMMLEGRAPLELAAMVATTPWLRRLPRGDGHPVVVFPGLGADDFSTLPLRRFLDRLGYATYPWRQGFNFGPRVGVVARCNARVRALFESAAQPVGLIGVDLFAQRWCRRLAVQRQRAGAAGGKHRGAGQPLRDGPEPHRALRHCRSACPAHWGLAAVRCRRRPVLVLPQPAD